MRKDDAVHVLMLSGYYDLTVPFHCQEDSMRKAAIPAGILISRALACGHGVYEDEVLRAEATDLTQVFYSGHAFAS